MKILDKITINEKEYICIQKLSINGSIIYVCQEKSTKQIIYLKENENNDKLEQTEDENIKKEVEKLIYAKSPDCIIK